MGVFIILSCTGPRARASVRRRSRILFINAPRRKIRAGDIWCATRHNRFYNEHGNRPQRQWASAAHTPAVHAPKTERAPRVNCIPRRAVRFPRTFLASRARSHSWVLLLTRARACLPHRTAAVQGQILYSATTVSHHCIVRTEDICSYTSVTYLFFSSFFPPITHVN